MVTGLPLAGLSKWAGTVGADYRTDVGSGEMILHGDMNFRSSYNSDTTNSQYTKISGYALVNASLGYRFNNNWEASVFARNLFDKEYITALTVQTGNSGLILGQTGDPRLVGLTIRFHQ